MIPTRYNALDGENFVLISSVPIIAPSGGDGEMATEFIAGRLDYMESLSLEMCIPAAAVSEGGYAAVEAFIASDQPWIFAADLVNESFMVHCEDDTYNITIIYPCAGDNDLRHLLHHIVECVYRVPVIHLTLSTYDRLDPKQERTPLLTTLLLQPAISVRVQDPKVWREFKLWTRRN